MLTAKGRETVGAAFESRPNALNFLRLCLALEVVVWHAYALRAGTGLPGWAERLLGDIAVDSFFAISGFLITRAWLRHPHVGRFLLARARRLLPGLWVCLLVTAFVIAPIAAQWSGSSAPSMSEQWSYIWQNALTRYAQPGIDGTPRGVPVAGAWNGSLWSLGFEVDCYLLVLVGGLCGLLRSRSVVAGGTLALCVLTAMGSDGLPPLLFRTLLMFGSGATLYLFADLVPRSRLLAGVSSALLAGSLALPNYRVLAAVPLAYLCIYSGLSLGRCARLRWQHDLSYGAYIYAFPIQQLMLVGGGMSLGWVGFASVSVIAVLPVSAVSWFLVERPAQRYTQWTARGVRGSVWRLRSA